MKILFVTVAWPQEGERNLYSDLLNEFKNHGHEIFVAYAGEKNDKTQLQIEDGIHVLRIATNKIQKAGKFKKALSLPFLGFKFRRYIYKHFSDSKFDLLLTHTPPITLSGLMIYLKKKYDAFFYLLLKDIWPHSSASLGVIKENGLIFKYFHWNEKRMYKTADAIGCMSPKNKEFILKKNSFLDENKVEICPNSIKPREFKFVDCNKIKCKYDIPLDATVFILSGNLGIGHGFKFYIETIEELSDYKEAFFLIGGNGTSYQYLKNVIAEKKLDNVLLYKWLPQDDFLKVLLTSDVGIILVSSKYTVPQFPSRLLAYLEASKPVLCAVNEETDIGSIVESAGCGLSVYHGDKKAFIKEIKRLSEDEELREDLAENSRKLLESRYTCRDGYSTIMSHF